MPVFPAAVNQCFSSEQLRGLVPRGRQFDLQRRRGRSGHGGATDTGSPCPSAPLPRSEGGALLGHLGSEKKNTGVANSGIKHQALTVLCHIDQIYAGI